MAKAFRDSCCSGDLEAVMRISLQREVDLNDRDQIGRTGLMLALLEDFFLPAVFFTLTFLLVLAINTFANSPLKAADITYQRQL